MSEFVVAAKVGDMPESGKLCLEIGDRFVVVAMVDGKYYCIDDVCSHDGGPLGDGELNGFCLSCPRHGAEFDVRSGAAVTMPATEPTVAHEVVVDGDNIMIKLSDS